MGGTAKRIGVGVATGGLSEFAQKNPYGAPLPFKNPIREGLKSVMGLSGDSESTNAIPGPFALDRDQMMADQAAITGLGAKQYDDMTGLIDSDQANRAKSREALAQALTRQAQDSFQQGLPDIMEDLNARNLLNGSGLGQEIARQQANVATNIANEVGVQGARDIDLNSQQRIAALTGKQGMETGALQRGFSLQDFINQANVAKTIGAQMAPPPPSGKAQFGTAAQGAGGLLQGISALRGK